MISKLRAVRLIGIVFLFVPFLGLPTPYKTGITIILGLALIYMSYTLKRAYKRLKFELRQEQVVSTTPHATI